MIFFRGAIAFDVFFNGFSANAFRWFWSQATIVFNGLQWLSTIGPTMECLECLPSSKSIRTSVISTCCWWFVKIDFWSKYYFLLFVAQCKVEWEKDVFNCCLSNAKINSNILPEVEEDIQHSDWMGAFLNFFERSAPVENSKKCKRMRSNEKIFSS